MPPDYGCPPDCDGSEAFHPSLFDGQERCPFCERPFDTQEALDDHVAKTHPLLAFAPRVGGD